MLFRWFSFCVPFIWKEIFIAWRRNNEKWISVQTRRKTPKKKIKFFSRTRNLFMAVKWKCSMKIRGKKKSTLELRQIYENTYCFKGIEHKGEINWNSKDTFERVFFLSISFFCLLLSRQNIVKNYSISSLTYEICVCQCNEEKKRNRQDEEKVKYYEKKRWKKLKIDFGREKIIRPCASALFDMQ